MIKHRRLSDANIGTALPVGRDTMSSALQSATNYHRWNYDWIAPYVAGRILDIGGGTGNHISFLTQSELVSIDLSSNCIEELRERYNGVARWSFEVGDITDNEVVARLGDSSFDTVLSCNVFEHIENDERAFLNSARLLKTGGNLVLLLPAHGWLYGSMDRLAGHFRRYSADDAARKLASAGLEHVATRYVNLVGALGWFVNNRLFSHRDLSSTGINGQIRIFDRLLIPILKRFESTRNMPFGQSLVCVGRKPSTQQ
jgi:SAM-dependent methyltransferase